MALSTPSSRTFSGLTPNITVDITVGSQTPDPDRTIRVLHAFLYFKEAWYCIASFIALLSIAHLIGLLSLYRRAKANRAIPKAIHDRSSTRRGPISLRRLPSAILNLFRSLAFRWTIPVGSSHTLNLAEVLLTAAYATLVFTWSLVNSTSTKGVKYDPHYWANIAGNVVSTQLPLMTALGMKNNIISYLTGVSFDKLNYLHRMSARVLCILIWLHGAGRIKLGLTGQTSWSHAYIQCGLLAATSFTVLIVVSIRPLRERHYEFFLISHFILAFIVLLSAFFHTEGLELGYLVWPAFIIWGIDRFLRLVRIIAYNFGYFKPGDSKELNAHVEVLSPHFIRLVLYRPQYFHWRPGQSVYLSIPGISALPFESHPFTISTIDNSYDSRAANETSLASKQLLFLLRVRNGFTKRLLESASDSQSLRVFLDGPYSSPPLLIGFDTVIFVAGGSGVAFVLPLFLDLIRRSCSEDVKYQHIIFIWSIRELSHIQWVSDVLSKALTSVSESVSIDMQIFISTTVAETQSWDDDSVEKPEDEGLDKDEHCQSDLLRFPVVKIRTGRADLFNIISKEIAGSPGDVSVNVCGTHALADAVRKALRNPRFFDILKGGPKVSLHVEAFGSS